MRVVVAGKPYVPATVNKNSAFSHTMHLCVQ